MFTDELLIDIGSIEDGRVIEVDAELQRPEQARPRVLLAGSVRLCCIEPCTDIGLRRREVVTTNGASRRGVWMCLNMVESIRLASAIP